MEGPALLMTTGRGRRSDAPEGNYRHSVSIHAATAAAAEHNGLKLNQTGVNVQKVVVQSECLDHPGGGRGGGRGGKGEEEEVEQ